MSRAVTIFFTLLLHSAMWAAVLTEHPIPSRVVYAVASLSVALPCLLFVVLVSSDGDYGKLTLQPKWHRLLNVTVDGIEVVALVGFGWWWCAAGYGFGAAVGALLNAIAEEQHKEKA